MRKLTCTSCGNLIAKSSTTDPRICRECEYSITADNRYAYLDQ